CAGHNVAPRFLRALRAFACSLAFSVLAVDAVAAGPALSELRAVSVVADPDSADVRIDFSRPAPYKLFTLSHPRRVVIDVDDVRPARGARLPQGSGIVQSVRAGSRPHGGLRLVLELKTGAPASARWADDPARARAQLILSIGTSQADLPVVP